MRTLQTAKILRSTAPGEITEACFPLGVRRLGRRRNFFPQDLQLGGNSSTSRRQPAAVSLWLIIRRMESRSGKNSPDSLTFEQSLREIEKIVAQIESGKLPLAEVVAEFKRATELIRISRKLLTEVEQQIKQIEPELFKSSARRG